MDKKYFLKIIHSVFPALIIVSGLIFALSLNGLFPNDMLKSVENDHAQIVSDIMRGESTVLLKDILIDDMIFYDNQLDSSWGCIHYLYYVLDTISVYFTSYLFPKVFLFFSILFLHLFILFRIIDSLIRHKVGAVAGTLLYLFSHPFIDYVNNVIKPAGMFSVLIASTFTLLVIHSIIKIFSNLKGKNNFKIDYFIFTISVVISVFSRSYYIFSILSSLILVGIINYRTIAKKHFFQLIGIAIVVLTLRLLFNYIKWDSFLEFGYSHALHYEIRSFIKAFSVPGELHSIPYRLHGATRHFFGLFLWKELIPNTSTIQDSMTMNPANSYLFIQFNIFWISFLYLFSRKDKKSTNFFNFSVIFSFLAPILFMHIFITQNFGPRYILDFLPALYIILFAAFINKQSLTKRPKTFMAVGVLFLLINLSANLKFFKWTKNHTSYTTSMYWANNDKLESYRRCDENTQKVRQGWVGQQINPYYFGIFKKDENAKECYITFFSVFTLLVEPNKNCTLEFTIEDEQKNSCSSFVVRTTLYDKKIHFTEKQSLNNKRTCSFSFNNNAVRTKTFYIEDQRVDINKKTTDELILQNLNSKFHEIKTQCL